MLEEMGNQRIGKEIATGFSANATWIKGRRNDYSPVSKR
jgi:hypothetical protein